MQLKSEIKVDLQYFNKKEINLLANKPYSNMFLQTFLNYQKMET